jgi:hypothetical protein
MSSGLKCETRNNMYLDQCFPKPCQFTYKTEKVRGRGEAANLSGMVCNGE